MKRVSTYADFSSCEAYVLPDGSRMIRLRGGGGRIRVTHSYFGREFTARILSPPPRLQGQRFDVALHCEGDAMKFDLLPGHSLHLAKVRINTLSADRLVAIREETGNDWRTFGTLGISWTEEEVRGVVEGLDVRPSNVAIPIRMAFRLDWQQGGDVRKLLDCDPYRGWQKVLTEPLPKPAATQ